MPIEVAGEHGELVDRSGMLAPYWSIEHFATVVAVGLVVGLVLVVLRKLHQRRR